MSNVAGIQEAGQEGKPGPYDEELRQCESVQAWEGVWCVVCVQWKGREGCVVGVCVAWGGGRQEGWVGMVVCGGTKAQRGVWWW